MRPVGACLRRDRDIARAGCTGTLAATPMRTTRRTRFATALITLVSLLFMQLAVASYVCPGALQKIAGVAALSNAVVPCADLMSQNMGVDNTQPNLCKAYCEAGQQSADTYQVTPLASVLPVRGLLIAPTVASRNLPGLFLQTPLLVRATAPPLIVRNCCFRI